jgi:hypothetical protein
MEVLIKKIKGKETANYTPSTYFPIYMKRALKSSNIRENDFILGPLYSNNDFQVGLTGTVKKGETYRDAIIREIGEEVGLIPDENYLSVIYFSKGYKVYSIYINDCIPINRRGYDIVINDKEDTNKKVGCYIYGSKNDISKFFSRKNIYLYNSPDDIHGIAGVKKATIF